MTSELKPRRRRGMGALKILKDGSAVATIRTLEGGTSSRKFATAELAEKWLARATTHKDDGTFVSARRGSVTVAHWSSEWRRSKVNLRQTTAARLDGVVAKHVLPRFGRTRLSGIRNSAIRSWVAEMEAKGLSASTIRKSYSALRDMLQAAVADRRISFNPADNVPLPVEQRGEQRFLDVSQIQELAGSIAPRFQALVMLLAYGGFRWGEACGLRRERLDLDRGLVKITQTMVEADGVISFGPPKTKRSLRMVPLPRRAVDELRRHLDAYVEDSPESLVFTHPKGKPLYRGTFRRDYWLPAVRAAGLDGLRVHDLRHTFVALWVAAGRNIKEVSVAAGHSSVAFTLDRYGHLYDSDQEGIQDALDALLEAREARKIAESSRNGKVAYL